MDEKLLLARLPRPSIPRRSSLGSTASRATAEHHGSELVADLPLQDRPVLQRGFLQHVVQDAGDDGRLLAAVAGQDIATLAGCAT